MEGTHRTPASEGLGETEVRPADLPPRLLPCFLEERDEGALPHLELGARDAPADEEDEVDVGVAPVRPAGDRPHDPRGEEVPSEASLEFGRDSAGEGEARGLHAAAMDAPG